MCSEPLILSRTLSAQRLTKERNSIVLCGLDHRILRNDFIDHFSFLHTKEKASILICIDAFYLIIID
jgi:spore coat polysaccharide biosynthesis predicted glycosyltransferase SpsG